jgi:hypothetical protein
MNITNRSVPRTGLSPARTAPILHLGLVALISLAALLAVTVASPVYAAPYADVVDYGSDGGSSGWILTTAGLSVTRDLGATWETVTPALAPGEYALAADFLTDGTGWVVLGRPAEDDRSELRLARTSDWGATWSYAPLSLFAPDDSNPTIAFLALDFTSSTDALLRVRHVSSSNFEQWSAWQTADGGDTWQRADDVAAEPVAEARFADPLTGWRLDRAGDCSDSSATRTCRQAVTLNATADGGRTWQRVPLPREVAAGREFTLAQGDGGAGAASAGSRTMAAIGQGFDKCEVATLEQLWDWRMNSPYRATNLYIGGSKRYCANTALSADYLRSAASMGWTFIPTWVGPQSPCYAGGKGGISRDPATAQSQGWAEAQAAADTLARLGLTAADGTGSIAYYDMEYYNTSDATCNAAVQAFVTGWVNGLRGRGHLAGVYGTGSTLRLLANLPAVPNVIWAAHWIYDAYTPDASVWDVYALSNGLWVNQQRLRQYTGGHWETWGSSAMNIDSNALDGIVAVMDPPAPPTATPTATPTRAPITPVAWQYLPVLLR